MIHLKNVNTIHPCNVIQEEGSHPSTWIRLHECNVFTSFKCIATILHREVKNCHRLHSLANFISSGLIVGLRSCGVDVWMGGCVDGWMGRWVDVWMGGWVGPSPASAGSSPASQWDWDWGTGPLEQLQTSSTHWTDQLMGGLGWTAGRQGTGED